MTVNELIAALEAERGSGRGDVEVGLWAHDSAGAWWIERILGVDYSAAAKQWCGHAVVLLNDESK